jgi:hypothetical protein
MGFFKLVSLCVFGVRRFTMLGVRESQGTGCGVCEVIESQAGEECSYCTGDALPEYVAVKTQESEQHAYCIDPPVMGLCCAEGRLLLETSRGVFSSQARLHVPNGTYGLVYAFRRPIGWTTVCTLSSYLYMVADRRARRCIPLQNAS